MLLRLAIVLAIVAANVTGGARAAAAAGPCGSASFAGTVVQLRAIEAETSNSAEDVALRASRLAAIAGDGAPMYRAATNACAGERPADRAADLARLDVLVVWARMIALRAVEAPVYPSPYRNACHVADITGVQAAFVEAWAGRLALRGTTVTHDELWRALGSEPLFAHVGDVASERAKRLMVRDLPNIDSDEDRWVRDNDRRHDAAASEAAANDAGNMQSCGPRLALWGMPRPAGPQSAVAIRR